MKRTKIPAALLAICALLTIATACGDSAGGNTVTTAADTAGKQPNTEDTAPLDELDLRKLIDDGLGEYDFGSRDYRIITSDDMTDHYFIEETTGDVVEDAVFERNAAVEERFNCKIKVVADLPYGDCATHVSKLVTAGDDAFDLLAMHVVMLGQIVPNGYFLNWYDIPNVDFTKPWWSQSNINDLTHNGVCISALGNMLLSTVSGTYCMYYNKALGSSYDFPELYDVVNDGEWTIDYVTQLAKDIYQDLNQNGKVDFRDDSFGLVTGRISNLTTYLWAFDNPIFTKNGEALEFTYKTSKLNEIITKLYDTYYLYDGIQCNFKDTSEPPEMAGYPITMFAARKAVFATGTLGAAAEQLREMEDDYAILPYPKWDTAQEAYYTMCDGSHQTMVVPITAPDLEFVGTVTEAMNAESYKTLIPAYYDIALKVKGTRDEESVAMLDMIFNSCVFDFGYVYDGWKGVAFYLESLLIDGKTNIESYYARKEKAVNKYYSKLIDYFENYGME